MGNVLKFNEELTRRKDKIIGFLPTGVDGERYVRSAGLMWFKNPALQKCSVPSVMEAIYTAAQLGLDFIETSGNAYLIPYKNSAKFIPGYRGLIKLMTRNPEVLRIEAQTVRENDEFTIVYGTAPAINHVPSKPPRGNIIGAYAIAFFKDGTMQFEYMDADDLAKVRRVSQNANGQVYKDWEDQMARKAPVRRLFKFMPSSPELEKAIEADNQIYEFEEPEMQVPDMVQEVEKRIEPEEPPEPPIAHSARNPQPKPEEPPDDIPEEIENDTLKAICDKKGIPVNELHSLSGKYGWQKEGTEIGNEERLQFARTRIGKDIQGEISNLMKLSKKDLPERINYIWEFDKPGAGSFMLGLKK